MDLDWNNQQYCCGIFSPSRHDMDEIMLTWNSSQILEVKNPLLGYKVSSWTDFYDLLFTTHIYFIRTKSLN